MRWANNVVNLDEMDKVTVLAMVEFGVVLNCYVYDEE